MMPPYVMDYQNPTYFPQLQALYFQGPQGSEYYNPAPCCVMPPFNPYTASMTTYSEPAASKGPPDTKKSYTTYYPPVQPKHEPPKSIHAKNEDRMDSRNKPLDRAKPPQGALKITKPDTKKPIKIEAPDNADDKRGPRLVTRGPARPAQAQPAQPSQPAQPPPRGQEPPPMTSPPHQKVFPAPVPAPVPAPIIPMASVVIPISQAVPPVTVIPRPVPVLPGPPPVVAHAAMPLEGLPGAAVVAAPLAAAPPQPVPIPMVVPSEVEVEMPCTAPVVSPQAPAVVPAAQVVPVSAPSAPAVAVTAAAQPVCQPALPPMSQPVAQPVSQPPPKPAVVSPQAVAPAAAPSVPAPAAKVPAEPQPAPAAATVSKSIPIRGVYSHPYYSINGCCH